MAWKDLPHKEKAAYIHTAVRNGLTTIDEIADAYNEFAEGGHIYANGSQMEDEDSSSSTTPYKYIGGGTEQTRIEALTRMPVLKQLISTLSKEYGVSPNLVAYRLGHEGALDDAVRAMNNAKQNLDIEDNPDRENGVRPVKFYSYYQLGMDDSFDELKKGMTNPHRYIPYVYTREINEQGRVVHPAETDSNIDRMELYVAGLAGRQERAKKKGYTGDELIRAVNRGYNAGEYSKLPLSIYGIQPYDTITFPKPQDYRANFSDNNLVFPTADDALKYLSEERTSDGSSMQYRKDNGTFWAIDRLEDDEDGYPTNVFDYQDLNGVPYKATTLTTPIGEQIELNKERSKYIRDKKKAIIKRYSNLKVKEDEPKEEPFYLGVTPIPVSRFSEPYFKANGGHLFVLGGPDDNSWIPKGTDKSSYNYNKEAPSSFAWERELPEVVVTPEVDYKKLFNGALSGVEYIYPKFHNIMAAANYVKRHTVGDNIEGTVIDLSNQNVSRITPNTSSVSSILFNDFEERSGDSARKAIDFKNTNDTLVGDRDIPLKDISTFYGVEDGKLKIGPLDIFKDNTIVHPNRQKNYGKIKEVYLHTPTEKETKELAEAQKKRMEAINKYNIEHGYGEDNIFDRILSLGTSTPLRRLMSNNSDWINVANAVDAKYPVNMKSSYVINENNDTIPIFRGDLNAAPKVIFGDENGNSLFVAGLSDNQDKVNEYLRANPRYIGMVDNGRYSGYQTNLGSYNLYTAGDVLRDPNNLFIYGTTKK